MSNFIPILKHLLLKKTLIALFAGLFVAATGVYGPSNAHPLSSKQLAKSENVIRQLEQFHTLAEVSSDLQQSAGIKKLLTKISKAAGGLHEGDAKAHIKTAVYWYEQANLATNHTTFSESVESRCVVEKPGAYQDLCNRTSGSRRDFLRAKAALHVNWAKALIKVGTTEADSAILEEVTLQSRNDHLLSTRAIELLRVLASEVITYDSLGDFQDGGNLARVSFEVFKKDLEKVSAEVEILISWLPESRLKCEIRNALLSYQIGGFWWAKIYLGRVVNVSQLGSPETVTTADTNYVATIPYTVAIYWRYGSRYINRAEKLLAKTSTGKVSP